MLKIVTIVSRLTVIALLLGNFPILAVAQECPPGQEPVTAVMSQQALDVVDLVNVERENVGLNPVEIDARLVEAAQLHTEDMATAGFFSHTGSDGSTFVERILRAGYECPQGETIGAGYQTAAAMVQGWMDSAQHRAILLDSDARHIGVGYVVTDVGYGVYWTVNLGSCPGDPQSCTGADGFYITMEPDWNLISIPFNLPDNSLGAVLQSIDNHYESVWAYDAANRKWQKHVVEGPDFLNNLTEIVAGRGYWIKMIDSTPLIVDGDEVADDPMPLELEWNLVGYNCLTPKALEEALSSIAQDYEAVWTYYATEGKWKKYVVGGPDFLNDLETMEPRRGYWIKTTNECVLDVNCTDPPAAPSVVVRSERNVDSCDKPEIPYTLWGRVEADGLRMTGESDCTVFLKVDGKIKAGYRLGTVSSYGDFYVLDIPVCDDCSSQAELWVQIDDAVARSARMIPGRPGQIIHFDLSVQLSRVSMLYQNYPNPCNPDTWIPYQLSEGNYVVIKIYTATGQLARTLRLGYRPAGVYISKDKAAHWDGKNEAGEQVSSGVYFYTIQVGDFTAMRKMTIAR